MANDVSFPGFLWNFFQTIRICGKFNFLLLQFSVILLNNKKQANTGKQNHQKHWFAIKGLASCDDELSSRLVSTTWVLISAAEWLISGWPSKKEQNFARHWYVIKMMIAKVPFHMTWSWWGLQNLAKTLHQSWHGFAPTVALAGTPKHGMFSVRSQASYHWEHMHLAGGGLMGWGCLHCKMQLLPQIRTSKIWYG